MGSAEAGTARCGNDRSAAPVALLPGNEGDMVNTHAGTPAHVRQVLDDLEAVVAAGMTSVRELRRDDGSPELGGVEPPD